MKVADLMQTEVRTVHCDATIADAIITLADRHVSALPVVDSRGRMVGVVSSTDVIAAEAEREPAEDTLAEETPVRNIMTPGGLTISPGADVREAAQQMLYGEVHRLFVVDEGRPIGVVSTTDIVRAVATGGLGRATP